MDIEFTDKQEEALNLLLDHKFTLLFGGSRSGKTFITIFLILWRAQKKKSRHAILRFRFAHVKQSIWYDTFPKVAELLGIKYKENKSDWFVTLENGSEIWFGGLDDKDRVDKILGNEYSTIFLNETSQISYDAYTTVLSRLAETSGLKNRLIVDENPPTKAHWTYKVFIEGLEPETKMPLKNKKEYTYLQMNPGDNVRNLPDDYLEILENLPAAKRKRFLKGEFADAVTGALWTESIINQYRTIEAPKLKEIIISVDPATTANITSDETGIIVIGKGFDNRGYLLEDKSGIYSPSEWSTLSVALYVKYGANYIVAEKNQGGDMVKHTIKTANENVPVKLVHATKGKILRAEPISTLYEDGKISHVGIFPDAEEEMTTYTGNPGDKSPNRLDGIVHGFTHLFPIKGNFDAFW
jgi:PBSX family phage terminase large subunit